VLYHVKYDDDDQWLIKYYIRKVMDLTSFAVVPLSVFVVNMVVIWQVRVVPPITTFCLYVLTFNEWLRLMGNHYRLLLV